MLEGFVSDVKRWAMRPYKEDGDVVDWILFIGLLTVCGFLWTRVLKRIGV